MLRWIPCAALTAAATVGTGAAADDRPACPGPGAAVLERFTSAECVECWSRSAQATAADPAWLFDWITPTPAGADAPLSAAAPAAARERAERSGGPSLQAQQTLVQRDRLPASGGLRMQVLSGPAWHGYIGVQIDVRGRAPEGATAWIALVEAIPAGTDGSGVARELLREVAGPLPLTGLRPGRPLSHLAALRLPQTAQPARLYARGWIESAGARMLAVASTHCAVATASRAGERP